jgi:hypothetical protein
MHMQPKNKKMLTTTSTDTSQAKTFLATRLEKYATLMEKISAVQQKMLDVKEVLLDRKSRLLEIENKLCFETSGDVAHLRSVASDLRDPKRPTTVDCEDDEDESTMLKTLTLLHDLTADEQRMETIPKLEIEIGQLRSQKNGLLQEMHVLVRERDRYLMETIHAIARRSFQIA